MGKGNLEHVLMAINSAATRALSIAHKVRRIKRADGGRVHVGPIRGDTGGRADNVPLTVPGNCYVIPADIVSGMGEGNTEHGMKVLDGIFGSDHAQGAEDSQGVPIQAADGEYVIGPAKVSEIGGGDPDRGHKTLDEFVVLQRGKLIKTLKSLPGPAKK